MPTYNIFLCYYWCKAFILGLLFIIGRIFKNKVIIDKVESIAKLAFFGELFAVTLECSLEILASGFMSARANLWTETGDIIGGIFAYISIILVIAIMPTVGIFIGFLEKTKLEEEFFKNNLLSNWKCI